MVAQYRSSWKTTFLGSVFAIRMSNAVRPPNMRWNSQLWLCTISVWPALRARAPSSFRYSAYATHSASVAKFGVPPLPKYLIPRTLLSARIWSKSAGFCGVPTSTCRAEALSPYLSSSARYCSAVRPLSVNGSTLR